MEIKHSETVNVINEYLIKSTLKLNSQYFSHFFHLESAVFFFGGQGLVQQAKNTTESKFQ